MSDTTPISVPEAKALFAPLRGAPALVLAVSGGPDSVALMWLAARWRRTLRAGPRLVAVTVDHGLRRESAREARGVRALARTLDVPHRTMRWRGDKPATGVPAAAREARYRELAAAARAHGATHIVTAHTRDDQAETLLMRLARGSGLTGLAAMARASERDGLALARPLLDVPKSRLVATLARARISFVEDPANVDPQFTRPRVRALMPALAAEGCDARTLARLAARLARADAALDILADGAARYLGWRDDDPRPGVDAQAFAGLAEEIRVRLLLRRIGEVGHEGPPELGKVEALALALAHAMTQATAERGRGQLKQTLAGALISLRDGRLAIDPAPPRRAKR